MAQQVAAVYSKGVTVKKLLWLSFAEDGKCLGVVITEAEDVVEGAKKCRKNGVNPGGQVLSYEIPEDAKKERALPRDVLLSDKFLIKKGYIKLKDQPKKVRDALQGLKCAGDSCNR